MPPSRKTRGPALTPERIARTALEISNEAGDFTMRSLGRALKVDPMAIYRHFENRDALVNAMIDIALQGIEAPTTAVGPPRERLQNAFGQLRDALAAHPGIAGKVSSASPTRGSNTRDAIEAGLGALRELGMDTREASRAYLILVRFVVGSVVTDAQLRDQVQTDDGWRENVTSAYGAVEADRHPNIREAGRELVQFSDTRAQFVFALGCLLDGLVAAIGRPD